MAERPCELIEDFVSAGADLITVHAELGDAEITASLQAIRTAGCAAGLASEACPRLTAAAALRGNRRAHVRLIADGGIRTHTVPLLRRAGADVIVPGSLAFRSPDLEETFSRLRTLP